MLRFVPCGSQPVSISIGDEIFCHELVAYGSTLRGIALAAAEALLTIIPRLLNVEDVGSWDLEQSLLTWVVDISRGSARKLLKATLPFLQVCAWHDGENVKTHLHAKVHDNTSHRPLTKLYHAVLNGTITPAQYEELAPRSTPQPGSNTYVRTSFPLHSYLGLIAASVPLLTNHQGTQTM